ncbi:ferredoxin [Streptomyces acidicola]|uniref:ferredoxin n=1 Tax=Streptomyces acidicola TaxID=2596892 RepID=UPI0037F55882
MSEMTETTETPVLVRVDGDQCCGYGICAEKAPEVFDLNDDGQATAPSTPLPAHLHAPARQAAAACPVRAVHLTTP